jgi:hypothetical protein
MISFWILSLNFFKFRPEKNPDPARDYTNARGGGVGGFVKRASAARVVVGQSMA